MFEVQRGLILSMARNAAKVIPRSACIGIINITNNIKQLHKNAFGGPRIVRSDIGIGVMREVPHFTREPLSARQTELRARLSGTSTFQAAEL